MAMGVLREIFMDPSLDEKEIFAKIFIIREDKRMLNRDFKSTQYTAIISDLHLCEAEPVNKKFPLWKKYKTREFFYDDVVKEFLSHIESMASGEKVELILNGDIFDFDSVTSIPEEPLFHVTWVEKKRGLFPREERALYKMKCILRDHAEFFSALRGFMVGGHKVVLIFGNHDVELHYNLVQAEIRKALDLPEEAQSNIRFVEWFYVSNQDTLIEHGNQYDAYCVFEDPINPFMRSYNYVTMKLPFGNLACRYIMNGMGFFNPHVDTNYIMNLKDYVAIFLRYMARAQPLVIFTWFGGALMTLYFTMRDRILVPLRNPLRIEDRIQRIADRSNVEPRVVREMKELFVSSSTRNPFLIMKELWLDRAFLLLVAFIGIFQLFTTMKAAFGVSLFWGFIPLFLMVPFFLFYSKSIISNVSTYKEPDERILAIASSITSVKRIVYGHTHVARHEIIGPVEHLNSGSWSPAFLDIECAKPVDQKTFVWIFPSENQHRKAELRKFVSGHSEIFRNPRSK